MRESFVRLDFLCMMTKMSGGYMDMVCVGGMEIESSCGLNMGQSL